MHPKVPAGFGGRLRGKGPQQRDLAAQPILLIDVLAQDQPQVPFAGDQHPVQALAAGTGNPALRDRVRTRRPDRRPDDPHCDCGEHGGITAHPTGEWVARTLQQNPPAGRAHPSAEMTDMRVRRRDRLGGLIHEYAQVA